MHCELCAVAFVMYTLNESIVARTKRDFGNDCSDGEKGIDRKKNVKHSHRHTPRMEIYVRAKEHEIYWSLTRSIQNT